MTILHESMWPAPRELSGVKSRKRPIFEFALGSVDASCNGVHRVSGLKLTLESRICALGFGGRLAVELLLGRPEFKGKVHRHAELQVAHLGSHLAGDEATIGEHLAAVTTALEMRPQVLVLDAQGSTSWKIAFEHLLEAREGLRNFRGAVILAVEEESEAVKDLCTQRWRQGGSWLWQEAIQQDLMILEDVLKSSEMTDEVEGLLGKVRHLSAEAFFGEDSVEKSHERGWSLCLMIDQSAEVADRFCGYMCYQLSSKSAEFHIARIAVIARSRGKGYGKHFMQWALEKCALLPRSACAWISLSALDEAVPFYEHFGFTDMTCDDLEDDEHIQTWMELKNISVAAEPDDSDND